MILKRRTRAGKTRYAVRVDRAGKQVWIGTFATIGEARKHEAKAKLARRSSPMSCDRYAEFWLEGYRARVKTSSYDTAASALKGFIDEYRGIPLSRLEPIGAEKWARKNRWRIPVVISMLNAAVQSELLDRNPFAGLAHRTQGRKRVTPLTVIEVESLAQGALEAHGTYGPTMRALVLFLAYSGVRVGEAFGLEWSDIDFKRMRIRIDRRVYRGSVDLPKSNRPRLIVLTPQARDAILGLPREGRVFHGKQGGELSQSLLSWYWEAITAKFGRKVTPHELRHFAAHHLYVTMGLPARVVAAQLGHDGPKLIEDLYGHGDVGALEEIDAAFENVVPIRKAAG